MEITETPDIPALNRRGNIYCHDCNLWVKGTPAVNGIRYGQCMAIIPVHPDPVATSTANYSPGEIRTDNQFTTPSTSPPSDPANKNSDTDARSTTKESPEEGNRDIPLETTFSKILLSAHKKKLFQNSTPIKDMDNIHRNFQDEGYNDEPIPRENIQLPSYSGDDNDNVDALEEKLKIYCKIKGISEVGKLDRIPFCLTGRAFTLFSGLPNSKKRDMGAILKALRDNFEKTPLPPSVAYQVLGKLKC